MTSMTMTTRGASLAVLLGVAAASCSNHQASDEPAGTVSGAPAASGAPTPSGAPSPAASSSTQKAPSASARSAPIKLAASQQKPLDLRVDEQNVYWIASGSLLTKNEHLGDGSVVKLPKTGGEPVTLAKGEDLITSIEIDRDHVYWSSLRGVFKVPKAGGPTTELHHAEKGRGIPSIVAVSSPVVFVGITALKDGGLYAITTGAKEARPVTTGFGGVHGIAIVAGGVFMCVGPSGKTLGFTPTGGEDQILAEGLGDCTGLAHDGGNLFWTERRTHIVRTMPDSGGAPTTLASNQTEPWAIAVRAGWVYWSDRDGHAVRRVRSKGGDVETIATGPWKPQGIAVDAEAIYWTAPEEGGIYKLALDGTKAARGTSTEAAAPAVSASPVAPADKNAAGPTACAPCSSQEDFDAAMKAGSKCCPVIGCQRNADCSGGRVCCKIPDGQLCGDASRCKGANRVER